MRTELAFGRRMRWAVLGAATVCVASISGCSRFKTTDQLRDELRGTTGASSFMRFPCQTLTVDEFGWRLDSLDGVLFRVHSSVRQYGGRSLRNVSYRSASGSDWLSLSVPQQVEQFAPYMADLSQPHREDCSIRERTARVVTGFRGFRYETTVMWDDIGDGRQMIATVSGRDLDELQVLRATLFTMRFPGAGE